MTRRPQSIFIYAALAAGLIAAFLPARAHGEPLSVCVRCTSPVQSYLCEVAGANLADGSRNAGFYCAARLAEEHGHRTCAVARNDARCEGDYRRYVYEPEAAGVPAIGVTAEELPEAEAAERAEQDAKKQEKGPPETVVELTRETARKTGESLKRAADETAETTRSVGEHVRDAADAVGRATRNAMKCIGSLFDDC